MSNAAKTNTATTDVKASSKWAKFKWEDPFRLDRQLTEDEELVADTAKAVRGVMRKYGFIS